MKGILVSKPKIKERRRVTFPSHVEEYNTVLMFAITFTPDGDALAEPSQDRPEIGEDRRSICPFPHMGIAVEIMWLSGKPAPKSEQRTHAIYAIYQHILSVLPPDLRALYSKGDLGIGHLDSGVASWIEQS